MRLGRRQPGLERPVDEQPPDLLERAPARRAPRCRRRDSAARRPPCRARRSPWRRRRRPRGRTGLRSCCRRLRAANFRARPLAIGVVCRRTRPWTRSPSCPPPSWPHASATVRSAPARPSRPALRRDRGARPAARRVHRARRRAGARRGGRDPARRPAPVRGRADRGQGEHRRRRAVHELRLALPRRAPADAQRVPRPPAARGGLRVVGTTNMPEFGILPTTEPRHTGPDAQPVGHARARRAARPAAPPRRSRPGSCPSRTRNDGGGSLRIPAACCGLVGLKPSRGRVSRGPDLGDSFLASDGVLTRTVAETALLLDVLAGYEPGDATWAPRPAEPYTLAMRREPRQAADRDDARQRARRRRRPRGRARPARGRRRCCASSATRSSRTSPALPDADSLDIFLAGLRARRSRSGSRSASASTGGRRRRTRSSRCRAWCSSSRSSCRRPAT